MNPSPLPLGPKDVGRRIVVRRELPAGGATDVLGKLLSVQAHELVVQRANGERIRIDAGSILAAKRVPPGPARVRPARPADAEAIEALRVGCWRTAYRGMIPDAYLAAMPAGLAHGVARRERLLGDQPADVHQLVAESVPAEAVVGWVSGGPSRDAGRAGAMYGEVYACYVAPEWSGVGLGGRLLRRLLNDLAADGRADVALWVLAANDRARRFYASYGFAPDGSEQTLDLGGPVVEMRCVRR
jgi:ribosomal protein S18 acetylase RimI-like enzyme